MRLAHLSVEVCYARLQQRVPKPMQNACRALGWGTTLHPHPRPTGHSPEPDRGMPPFTPLFAVSLASALLVFCDAAATLARRDADAAVDC